MRWILVLFLTIIFMTFPAKDSLSLRPIIITPNQAKEIGKKVCYNEIKNTTELTCWKIGEDHASIGIGHWIWYPDTMFQKRFQESFPDLLTYLEQHGHPLPSGICKGKSRACPWKTRQDFIKQLHSKEMEAFRNYLLSTLDLQARFMVERLEKAFSGILRNAASSTIKNHLIRQMNRLAHDTHGLYALVDYLNFKGEGLGQTNYQGHKWGLMQVLLEMKDTSGHDGLKDFATAAKIVINRRVDHAPNGIKEIEETWRTGWIKRINTYMRS